MKKFIVEFESLYGIAVKSLNLGGGFAIKYLEDDKETDLKQLLPKLIEKFRETNIKKLIIEPGRSIVGDSCFTLYNVGQIKKIENEKYFIFIDGGMGDNIRPALYQALYTARNVKIKDSKSHNYDIMGKCCESGDFIVKDALLPEVKENETLIIFSTGAYCYSMASNYNGFEKGAVIFVNGNKHIIACKRQSIKNVNSLYAFKGETDESF
jgi:diaminopimelate decarboxylase